MIASISVSVRVARGIVFSILADERCTPGGLGIFLDVATVDAPVDAEDGLVTLVAEVL